jgi:GNAT superfamily N-acetyltransferase
MEETALRLATAEDARELRAVIEASVRGLSAGHYSPDEIEASLAEVFGVDTLLIEDGTYFVAAAEGGACIAGCGGWSRWQTLFGGDGRKAGRPDSLLDPAKDAARIRAFYVRPEFARRGIAARILRACEAAALERGFRRFELIATLPGVPLYEAMGYERIEPFAIPLSGGRSLPAVRMGKSGIRSA